MRVLVVSTDWSGLVSPIVDEIRQQGHIVEYLDHSILADFSYFNYFDRIQSKIFNVFSGEKYKHLRTEEQIESTLRGFFYGKDVYDLAVFTNPDIFNERHFKLFKNNSRKLVLNLWDSLERMPKNRSKLHFFDVIRSFDPVDCKNMGFIPTTNYFHIQEQVMPQREMYNYDVFSVMTFCKERYPLVEKFIDVNPDLKCKILLYIDNERKRKYIRHPKVQIITKPVLKGDLREFISKSKSVLDLGYETQNGFSFRVFETLAWNKKLITTNKHVIDADFYRESNIYCLPKNYKVADFFIDSPYTHVPADVKNQYRLDEWVNRLLNLGKGL